MFSDGIPPKGHLICSSVSSRMMSLKIQSPLFLGSVKTHVPVSLTTPREKKVKKKSTTDTWTWEKENERMRVFCCNFPSCWFLGAAIWNLWTGDSHQPSRLGHTALAINGASFGGGAAATLSGPNKPYQTAVQPAFSAKWKCLEPQRWHSAQSLACLPPFLLPSPPLKFGH